MGGDGRILEDNIVGGDGEDNTEYFPHIPGMRVDRYLKMFALDTALDLCSTQGWRLSLKLLAEIQMVTSILSPYNGWNIFCGICWKIIWWDEKGEVIWGW